MPGSINPESGIYQYAYDDPRSPMHDVLNLLADSVHNTQKMNLAEQSQLADLVAAQQQATAPAFARSGLATSTWTQNAQGTIPFTREIAASGAVAVEDNGLRALIAGAYQISLGARVIHTASNVWRTVSIYVNNAFLNDATFDGAVSGTSCDINLSLPLELNAGDLVTVFSSASSSAYPSSWNQDRARFAMVRI